MTGSSSAATADASALPWWWTERLVPAPTVRVLTVGGRPVLHCERSQALFELDPAAARFWRELQAGRTPEAAAAGAAEARAAPFLEEAARGWLESGRLAVEQRSEPPPEVLNLSVGGASCAVELRFPPGHPLRPEAERVFGRFRGPADNAAARLSVTAQGPACAVSDALGPRGLLPPERVIPEIKAFLTEQVTRSATDGAFLIHAALLQAQGRALLLSGAPGAGKTTLTVALAASGLAYGGDDVVRITPDGVLAAVPFCPACKAGAWPLLRPYVPELERWPVHLRGDGQQARYASVGGAGAPASDRVGWVLLLDRRPGASAALEPVEPLTALAALLEGAYAADGGLRGDALERLAAQLEGALCRRLVYSDLAEAADAVRGLVRG